MRILFVNPVGQIGGAERVLLDCIASIRQAEPEHEIHVVLMDDGPLVSAAKEAGAIVDVVESPRQIREFGESRMQGRNGFLSRALAIAKLIILEPQVRSYSNRLLAAIDRIAPDVVHSNGLKTHLLLGRAKIGRPLLWHVHDFVGARPLMARLLRRTACGVTTVAVSQAIAGDIGRWLPGSSPVVVMNGVDLERFCAGEGDAGVLDGVDATDVVRVGLVATYARWKGQEIFLRAIQQSMHYPPTTPVRFYIIGGPIYTTRGSQYSREEMRSIARELGVAERVSFVPFQADPAPVYRALDIVVHASTQAEPFGLSVAEAMACGRPVIVSAAGGVMELIQDGIDAIAVKPQDVTGLARAMRELIDSPGRRIELGKAARASAEARFDRRRIGPQILAIYRTKLSLKPTKEGRGSVFS